jgi:hypothetical protein
MKNMTQDCAKKEKDNNKKIKIKRKKKPKHTTELCILIPQTCII